MWIIVATITILHICGIHFPNTTYLLMAVLIYLHTIVEHYTFALIPFDSVTEFFGFARNNFYRAAHFSVEFYAYAIAEMLGAVTATAFSFWMHGTWRIKSELSCAYHLG